MRLATGSGTLFLLGASLALAPVGCAGLEPGAPDEESAGEGDKAPADGPAVIDGAFGFLRVAEPVPNRYLVVLRDDVAAFAEGAASVTAALATEFRAQVLFDYRHVFDGFLAEMTEEDAIALATDPRVAFVEEDGVVRASATQTGATWGLDRIDQRGSSLDGSYTYANGGEGVTVYVIDTGIRTTHADFGGRARAGYSAVNDGRGALDCNGHGTHVAGTIGGATWGVAKGVELVAVRVLDCNGSGSNSGVLAGMDWVAQNASGPSVANMSLGGGASSAIDQAVQRMIDRGISVVVAAGNENQNACNGSPARAPEAITVASSTSGDSRSSFSNWGACVDLFAPGSNIKSAWGTSDTATSTISGTSMASPHVAGAAALYLAANPTATPSQVRDALVGQATANALSGVNGSPNRLLYTGFIGGGSTPPPSEPPPSEPPPSEPPASGTPRTGTASGTLARGEVHRYSPLSVKSGTTLTIAMNGTGDADLYVRFGAEPTGTRYDCRPYLSSSRETCSLTVPAGTTSAYFLVHGYTAATYQLEVSWVEP